MVQCVIKVLLLTPQSLGPDWFFFFLDPHFRLFYKNAVCPYEQLLLTPHVSTASQGTHGMRSFHCFGRTEMKACHPQWICEEQKRAIALCERSITTNAGDLNVM